MNLHTISGIIVAVILAAFIVYKRVTLKEYKQCLLDFLKFRLFTVIFAIVAIEIIYQVMGNVDKLFNFSILTAFVATSIIHIISSSLNRVLRNVWEDTTKLTENYSGLIKKYEGSKEAFYKIDDLKIPVIVDCKWDEFSDVCISSDNPNKMYALPEDIKEFRENLFLAHDTSNVYNQLNIRVDDWRVENKTLKIDTSRTTYYSSLMTNRVMDYLMNGEFSVRDLLQPGPFVPDLKDSVLSNHIGFNGFIISSDGYIPFVKRNRIISIGKSTYGTSVSASLKTMYVLDSYKGAFTKEGLINGIKKEILDELKIEEKYVTEIKILAAYRDIVEGNKPQLLVIAKVNKTMKDIETEFKTAMAKKKEKNKKLTKEEKEQEDGNAFTWFSKDEFIKLQNYADHFETGENNESTQTLKNQKYKIVPSVAASIGLTQEYLKEN